STKAVSARAFNSATRPGSTCDRLTCGTYRRIAVTGRPRSSGLLRSDPRWERFVPVSPQSPTPDAIVVGAGLSGLVAAHELTAAGKRVALVDQENHANLGGQAFWSFGGLFIVNTPEQRRLRIHDSL